MRPSDSLHSRPSASRVRRLSAARHWWLFAALPIAVVLLALVVMPMPATAPPRLELMTAKSAGVTKGIQLKAIDGGHNYFARKNPRSAWMDRHILLGAWLEQPQVPSDVVDDSRMGNNIYWNLAATPGPERADYNVIRAGGMHVSAPDTDQWSGSETISLEGHDESDMNFGPGWNRFSGSGSTISSCVPAGQPCGYTRDSQFYNQAGRRYAVHQGYGKGVLFWETPRQAAQFLKFSDILSADSYWLTDDDLQVASQGGCALLPRSATACGTGDGSGLTAAQAHLPANYAYDVTHLEYLEALNGPSKPVVVDIETGCPFSGGSSRGNCATPPQTVAAAWHALIAGARGIIWFQHNFSGPCVDFRTFMTGSTPSSPNYNCQQTPGVTLHDVVNVITAFNHEVTSLTNVLLAPTIIGYLRTKGDVSTLVKAHGGSCYVFSGSGRPASPPPRNQTVTFRVADRYTGRVVVVDEDRTLSAQAGIFKDTFANANTIHIYRIPAGSATSHNRVWPCNST